MKRTIKWLLLALTLGVVGVSSAPGVAFLNAQSFRVRSGVQLSWSFLYDYTTATTISSASTFLYGDYELWFVPTAGHTFVGYLYDANSGRYVSALAYLPTAL